MGNTQHRSGQFDGTVRLTDVTSEMINEVLNDTPHDNSVHEKADETRDEGRTATSTETKPRASSRPTPKPFVVRKVKHIQQLYSYDGVKLGDGSSCSVMKMQERQSGKMYAVKKLKMSVPFHARLFQREVEMLTTLKHPHIIQYNTHFADRKRFYVVTEFCKGRTLFDRLLKQKIFPEQEVAKCIRSILSVAAYLHSQDIVHRDFKCKNVCFTEHGPEGILKVIDFGDAKKVHDGMIYYDFVGTLHYRAPESSKQRTGEIVKKSDIWSIGVIAYVMLTGLPPFAASTRKGTMELIMKYNDNLIFPEKINVSNSCKMFIRSLLRSDPTLRLSANEALQHEWIVRGGRPRKHLVDIPSIQHSEYSISYPSQCDESSDYKSQSSTLTSSPMNPSSVIANLPPLAGVQEDVAVSNEDFDFGILDGFDINDYLDSVELDLDTQQPGRGGISHSALPSVMGANDEVMMTVDQERPNTTTAKGSVVPKGKKNQFRFSGIGTSLIADIQSIADLKRPQQEKSKKTPPAVRSIKSMDSIYQD